MICDKDTFQWRYYISYVLNKPKFLQLDTWMKHEEVRASKVFGWECELCGSKSRFKRRYKHTLIKRVRWHLNGRCPAEKERAKMAVIPL